MMGPAKDSEGWSFRGGQGQVKRAHYLNERAESSGGCDEREKVRCLHVMEWELCLTMGVKS